jgi:HD superfamily phosphohydrolase
MVYLEKAKIYKDVIHNSIRTTRLANAIIDNKIFQRLRHLHQLGACYFVFPNANNTRFEHSLGTYHLAGCVIRHLIFNSDLREINKSLAKVEYIKKYLLNKLNLPDNEESTKIISEYPSCLFDDYLIELIKIAGLVHDIGHGPFSHLFDEWLSSVHELQDNKLIHHENRSIMLFGLIIDKAVITCGNTIYKISDYINLDAYKFISTLIHPSSYPDIPKQNFIYQIISNSLNDLDVDKLDYLCRDSYYLGTGQPFSIWGIIEHIKIIDDNIVFPEKISYEIFKVYRSRYDMHKQFYNNKTVICIEYMLRNILNKLDKILKITPNIKSMNIEHFIKLTDSTILNASVIIEQLYNPSNYKDIKSDVDYVNSILDAINERRIYKCLYNTSYSVKDKINVKSIVKKILLENKEFNKSNIITTIIKIGLIGGEKTHPFDNLYFYNKKNNSSRVLSKSEISHLISPFFQEKLLFIIEVTDF